MDKPHIAAANGDLLPLKTKPWTHQMNALEFIAPLDEGMLAMDMGTGKTKVTIDLLNVWDVQSALILCPKSVISTWPKEFKVHSFHHFEVLTLDGKKPNTRKTKMAEQFVIRCKREGLRFAIVANYEMSWREPFATWAKDMMSFDCVICDESHKIKSPSGKASKYAYQLGKTVQKRLALTGTPMPHSPLDVYAQFRFLDWGLYHKNYTVFKRTFAVMGGYQNYQILRYKNLDILHDIFYSRAFRVMAEDVLDLPEFQEMTVDVALESSALKTYLEMANEMVANILDGQITAANAMVKMLRLMQITSGSVPHEDGYQVVSKAKLEVLQELVEGLPMDEPFVVFTQFKADVDNIKEMIQTVRKPEAKGEKGEFPAEISGRMDDKERFQKGETNSVVVNIKSGGAGIDLTRARYVFYFGMGLSLGDFQQSQKRVHRPGQTRNVKCYYLIANGTIDEKVHRALQLKEEVVDGVLNMVTQEGTL